MNEKTYQRKLQRLTEMRDAYKSALIAEGFMDLLIDLVFGRQIVNAGNKLANDPEYVKAYKKLKSIEAELEVLRKQHDNIEYKDLDYYFITYGIDLYELDRRDQYVEMDAIKKKIGKYRNIKPLNKTQQNLNRKLVTRKRR